MTEPPVRRWLRPQLGACNPSGCALPAVSVSTGSDSKPDNSKPGRWTTTTIRALRRLWKKGEIVINRAPRGKINTIPSKERKVGAQQRILA